MPVLRACDRQAWQSSAHKCAQVDSGLAPGFSGADLAGMTRTTTPKKSVSPRLSGRAGGGARTNRRGVPLTGPGACPVSAFGIRGQRWLPPSCQDCAGPSKERTSLGPKAGPSKLRTSFGPKPGPSDERTSDAPNAGPSNDGGNCVGPAVAAVATAVRATRAAKRVFMIGLVFEM
jgi:hypothetical protein